MVDARDFGERVKAHNGANPESPPKNPSLRRAGSSPAAGTITICGFTRTKGFSMEFKPFAIHVGYDTRVTEYEQGKRGKGPAAAVMNWLAESNISWQFDWHYPEATDPSGVFEMMEYIDLVQKKTEKGGGIFYFDTEEDRLLFCLKWLSNKEDTVFWHPV